MNPAITILCALASGFLGHTAPPPEKEVPPPPAPPSLSIVTTDRSAPVVSAQANVYSIGDPSPEEQLYVELINRARANPTNEAALLATTHDQQILDAYEFYNVDLALMQSQFSQLSPAQPVAINSKLTTAARTHSQDMFDHAFQEHVGSDGSTLGDRLGKVGYAGQAGENIYSYGKSVFHGHTAFEVDWGPGTGGMQTPPGHRNTIHNAIYREVGIGLVLGYNTSGGNTVGPQVVTQEFGNAQNSTPFITGVAYYDLNGNGFYDPGEGIGNVRVVVPGATYEGITARSGGYAIPVVGNGTYTVTFSGPGFTDLTRTVSVVGSKNLKLDFTPTYSPPVVSGPATPYVSRPNYFAISAVGGASTYEWRSFQKVPASREGAENDASRITITQSGTYDVIEGIIVKSGSFAFHLTIPSDERRSQYITLLPEYLVTSTSSVSFQSMLGYNPPDAKAQVQVSADGGANWQVVYNQAGSTDQPETSWKLRSASLAQFAGKTIKIRFGLEFVSAAINSTDLQVGWLLDDIQFANTEEIINAKTTSTTASSFQFQPESVGDFLLQAHAKTGHQFLDWGPVLSVSSTLPTGASVFRLAIASSSNSQLVLNLDLLSGPTPTQLTIESTEALNGTWQPESADVQSISSTQYRVAVTRSATRHAQFYRVRPN